MDVDVKTRFVGLPRGVNIGESEMDLHRRGYSRCEPGVGNLALGSYVRIDMDEKGRAVK